MIRLAVLALAMLTLQGCAVFAAIGALPIAAQVPIYGSMAVGGAALGNLGVNAYHDCRKDGGCKAIPLTP